MSSCAQVHGLHVITDEQLQRRFTHVELAALATAGGARVVQLREKRPVSTAALVETARAARLRTDGRARLIVNDRSDVAAAVDAAGVHLGRHDLDTATARRVLGRQAIIGATANNLAQALAAATTPVDYLGVGPVFTTGSKANPAPTLGIAGLQAIVRSVSLPVVAIGGITPERVAAVLSVGATGIAVLSAVVCAP